MKKVTATAVWGTDIIEDTDTHETSLQCLCGGIAMYPQRIVLTGEEVEELKRGALDIETLVYEICKGMPAVKPRLVPPFSPADLK